MRIFINILLLLLLSPVVSANSLAILVEEKCSKDSLVVELTTLEITNNSPMPYCTDSELSIFGEGIDNIIKLDAPSDEEMKNIEAEFKFLEEFMDLSKVEGDDEISYSEYQIVLSKIGEGKFREMLLQGGRMLLTDDTHLLTTMNFDIDHSSGNTITILSGSLTNRAKNALDKYSNDM